MMRGKLIPWLAGTALAILAVLPARAGLEEGLAAYQAGNMDQAIIELEPLAMQGDAQAQYYLGRIYAEGRGTVRNYSKAHTYLTLAADQGIVQALYAKAEIGDNLSSRDIIESVKRQQQILAGLGVPSGEGDRATLASVPENQETQRQQPAGTPVEDDIAGLSARALVKEIQAQLNRLGLDAGTPDGLYGPSTRQAIEAFQQSAGLPTDGEADGDLLRALRQAESG